MRLVALVLIALTSVAQAQAKSTSVAVVVNAPDPIKQKTQDVINHWFDTHGLVVESLPLPKEALKTFGDCLVISDMTCARGVVEKRGRSNNLVGITEQASGKGEKRSIQISAYWIAKDHEVVSLQRTCDSCTDAVLTAVLVSMIDDLAKRTPAMGGRVRITSQPPGLEAQIDNEAAGKTPVERAISFGQHTISVLRDDRVVAQEKINVLPGESLDVPIVVADEPEPEKSVTVVEHRSTSRTVPLVLMTVGAAAVVTGVVLYQTGGPTGESYTYRNMRPAGLATGISGGVAVAIGAIWFFRTGRESASQPSVSITNTSATIGWARSF